MKKNLHRGSTNIIILAVVIFGALIYFNVDLRSVVGTIVANPIFEKVWGILVTAWTSYLVPLGIYLMKSIGLFV